jgi:hypothetical protein
MRQAEIEESYNLVNLPVIGETLKERNFDRIAG